MGALFSMFNEAHRQRLPPLRHPLQHLCRNPVLVFPLALGLNYLYFVGHRQIGLQFFNGRKGIADNNPFSARQGLAGSALADGVSFLDATRVISVLAVYFKQLVRFEMLVPDQRKRFGHC